MSLMTTNVKPEKAAVVLNSLCFDYALRLRTAGTHLSLTYVLPMPVPPPLVVNNLPDMPMQTVWGNRLGHVGDDPAQWAKLWQANKTVAQAYGLNTTDLTHILESFPVFARKRPEFYAYLKARLAEWVAEFTGRSK